MSSADQIPNNDPANATPTADAAPVAQACMLRIVAGLHTGGLRRIEERAMVLVGSGDDCDIVLSDQGVAPHHALVSVIDGVPTVRALDAPVRVQGRTLQPGDPMALHGVQRITLGDAVIALGGEGDPVWSEVVPGYVPRPATSRVGRLRRLPLAAAVAAIALASVAIYVAANPQVEQAPDATAQLDRLGDEFGVENRRVTRDPEGVAVLQGTVDSAQVRAQLQARLGGLGEPARLDVRTGDDIARDVAEVLRTQGLQARTRYLGKGDVEVMGRFEDEEALRAAATSRAMVDVVGVRRVIPRNLSEVAATNRPAGTAKQPQKDQVRLVGVVRGKDAYVLGSDGSRYGVGAVLPDGGTLIAIGDRAWALREGVLQLVKTAPKPDADSIAADVTVGASTVGATAFAAKETGVTAPATATAPVAAPAPKVDAAAKPQET